MNLVNTHIIKDGENHYPNYNGIYNLTIAPSEEFIIYYTNKYASYFGDSDKGKIDTIRLSTMTTTLDYARKEQRELLEKAASVLKEVKEREYPCEGEESNCSGCKHVRNAEAVLAEINAIKGEARKV